MREIKFRAWHVENKVMVYFDYKKWIKKKNILAMKSWKYKLRKVR
tara:strand:+ start:2509 stop:2643 length:135 start_codon:yes stop_codon:yes gene_type:complete